jgi:hypothetical protein
LFFHSCSLEYKKLLNLPNEQTALAKFASSIFWFWCFDGTVRGSWRGEGSRGRRGKGETPEGTKDKTDKRNSLTEDTPRDAATNALRLHLHLHNFAYKTFKIKFLCLFCWC